MKLIAIAYIIGCTITGFVQHKHYIRQAKDYTGTRPDTLDYYKHIKAERYGNDTIRVIKH